MQTRHRALTAIACLALIPLTACTGGTAEDPTPTTAAAPETAKTTTAAPVVNEAGLTPEKTVQRYFEAFDAAAAEGWKDISYNKDFLTSELAKKADNDDTTNRDSGQTITGERKLSEWTIVEEADTSAVVEFCNDTSNQGVSEDGKSMTPDPSGVTESIGRFTLTRENRNEKWLISEKAYSSGEVTCADYFA